MTPEDAEEYTQSLGQIVAGSWRQIAWAQRQGIPGALGMTTEQWVQERLGGYVRLAIPERREAVRELTAPLADGGGGLSTREAAAVLGVRNGTVWNDQHPAGVQTETPDGAPPLEESRAAVQTETVDDPDPWSAEEDALGAALGGGETFVVSYRRHPHLIAWAERHDLFVRIDRRSDWGNPFELPDDGDRATVIANYETHYLPHKPSLLERLDDLRGKALGCWCAPEPCHGDVLKRWAERARER